MIPLEEVVVTQWSDTEAYNVKVRERLRHQLTLPNPPSRFDGAGSSRK